MSAMIDADIPLSLFVDAHAHTSHTPEDRGRAARTAYLDQLNEDYARLLAAVCLPDKAHLRTPFEQAFSDYRAGYRARYIAYLRSQSRIASAFIVGPANFPVRRMEQRSAVVEKRRADLVNYRDRMLRELERLVYPERAPILTSDSDALGRLALKIAEAESLQTRMRAVNTLIRGATPGQPPTERLAAIGYTPGQITQLLTPDVMGRIGYPSFALSNNAANIRRMKLRLATIDTAQATPASEAQGPAARVEDCPADNRVRLYFPGKPDAEVRTRLKRSAFRWTPSLGCWQAYRNPTSLLVARQIAGLPQE